MHERGFAWGSARMTGMPAFGQVADDEEIWKISAFVKALPSVSAETYESLSDAHEHEGEQPHRH